MITSRLTCLGPPVAHLIFTDGDVRTAGRRLDAHRSRRVTGPHHSPRAVCGEPGSPNDDVNTPKCGDNIAHRRVNDRSPTLAMRRYAIETRNYSTEDPPPPPSQWRYRPLLITKRGLTFKISRVSGILAMTGGEAQRPSKKFFGNFKGARR